MTALPTSTNDDIEQPVAVWCALRCLPGVETRVSACLRDLGLSFYTPRVPYTHRAHTGRLTQVLIPLVTGYIFIRMSVDAHLQQTLPAGAERAHEIVSAGGFLRNPETRKPGSNRPGRALFETTAND